MNRKYLCNKLKCTWNRIREQKCSTTDLDVYMVGKEETTTKPLPDIYQDRQQTMSECYPTLHRKKEIKSYTNHSMKPDTSFGFLKSLNCNCDYTSTETQLFSISWICKKQRIHFKWDINPTRKSFYSHRNHPTILYGAMSVAL